MGQGRAVDQSERSISGSADSVAPKRGVSIRAPIELLTPGSGVAMTISFRVRRKANRDRC
jgi:hypothetical protein